MIFITRIPVDLCIVLGALLIRIAATTVGILQTALQIFVPLHAYRARLVRVFGRHRLPALVAWMLDGGVVLGLPGFGVRRSRRMGFSRLMLGFHVKAPV